MYRIVGVNCEYLPVGEKGYWTGSRWDKHFGYAKVYKKLNLAIIDKNKITSATTIWVEEI